MTDKSKLVNAHTEGYNRGYAKAKEVYGQKLKNKRTAIRNRNKRIKELEAQIEKMKSCGNCRYGGYTTMKCDCSEPCNNKDKWEIGEWLK